ncbi:hypothetical protein NC653_035389 [Populus alba x Populus x berolinensis]|uniref:Uncharacterized protein n=1 Tax=Populus alba x Populus x berolinensis TaxID=444605 RepID=A0AAD6LPV2_9ROSI|nr:hypothetical protein NC653_035389 [Populus alba x Populus x berolinensis]
MVHVLLQLYGKRYARRVHFQYWPRENIRNSKLLQPGGGKNAAELLKDLAGGGIVREYAMEE